MQTAQMSTGRSLNYENEREVDESKRLDNSLLINGFKHNYICINFRHKYNCRRTPFWKYPIDVFRQRRVDGVGTFFGQNFNVLQTGAILQNTMCNCDHSNLIERDPKS